MNKAGIIELLKASAGDRRWLLVHSSLAHLRLSQGSFKWELLSAVRALVEQGYNFAFPAFTFTFTKNGVFDVEKSPSEVGVLADWVFGLNGSRRTSHPIYSHVLIGNDIERAFDCDTGTCFGEQSIYGFFERVNATIVMFGCDWSFCTPFHYFEQKYNVPYRYLKKFQSEDKTLATEMYVRNLESEAENEFSKILSYLMAEKDVFSASVGFGSVESVSYCAVAKAFSNLMAESLYCCVKQPKVVQKKLSDALERKESKLIVVSLMYEGNYEPLSQAVSESLRSLMPDRKFTVGFNEYGQMGTDIMSGKLELEQIDFCVFPSRLADVFNVSRLSMIESINLRHIEAYAGLIARASEVTNQLVIVNLFYDDQSTFVCQTLNQDGLDSYSLVSECNRLLRELLEAYDNVVFVTPNAILSQVELESRLWYLGRVSYDMSAFRKMADMYSGLISSELGDSIRLMVLDLDNTLWGGVLGEDGLKGINLGGDFPGSAFKDFQRTIKRLFSRGIALSIASKNDQDVALNAIQNHPDMLIKEEHLAEFQINWNEKYLNIIRIADSVGLGLKNIMFVDDNPLECEKVRLALPEVTVVELPADPSLYVDRLLSEPKLMVGRINKEDSKRASNYVTKRKVETGLASASNMDDFFASMDINLDVSPVSDLSLNRSVQLINKTNQFNTTTKRLSQKELASVLQCEGSTVVTVAYSDKNTDQEIIGLAILQKVDLSLSIELMLLSCRVLGRSVETALLSYCQQLSDRLSLETLTGMIIETERNTPVRSLFRDHGFSLNKANQWVLPANRTIKMPEWLTVNMEFPNE